MTIISVRKLRDCGVFRDFSWPNDLNEFGQFNLIYGWNGSGKTTLSKIFRALENRTEPPNGNVIVGIDGRDVNNDGFSQVTLPIKVFNRDFVTESIFPTDGGNVAPIFILGKENVEKQKQIEQLKSSLTEQQKKLQICISNQTIASTLLDKFCIDKARAIKDTLRSSGLNPYNNYNKGTLTCRANDMVPSGDLAINIMDDDIRDRLLTQIRSSPKSKVSKLTYRLPDLKGLMETVVELFSTTVVSTVIKSLKDDSILSSWVHSGLVIHKGRSSQKCFFCEQSMPRDRMSVLEAHFSTEYEDLLIKLDNQIETLDIIIRDTKNISVPNVAELYDDLSFEFKKINAELIKECDSVKSLFETLVIELKDKKNHAFERVALNVSVPDLNVSVVDQINETIQKHNQMCDDFQSRIDNARKQIENYLVATNLDEFLRLQDAFQATELEVSKTKDEVQKISDEIIVLEREIVEHRRPAEELNEDLRNYLGHNELRLEVNETGYSIMRHDKPAEDISEGEKTSIALLYFLKSLKDRRFNLENGVVVLDDPVSSLDANALYYAFGFIRENTKDAKQLLILTHNFIFFRQVRNWFHYLNRRKKRSARFYMVDCTHDGTRRCSTISALDPLLEQYDSEYHYLFARIYRKGKGSTKTSFEENYVFPNMARRLLESFLAFRHPQIAGELWKTFQSVHFDESKKVRILRFVHTHSHSSAMGEPEHDPSVLCETHAVLEDLMDLIKSEDPTHYSAMEKLVALPTGEEVKK